MGSDWMIDLSSNSVIDQSRVAVFGHSAGAYAAAELLAFGKVPFCGVGLSGVHGHGQLDLEGIPPKRADGAREKMEAFLQRVRCHGGAGKILASHALNDEMCRWEDARAIFEAINERQDALGLPQVNLHIVEDHEHDRPVGSRNKQRHQYMQATFLRTEFLDLLFGTAAPQVDSSRKMFLGTSTVCRLHEEQEHLTPPAPPRDKPTVHTQPPPPPPNYPPPSDLHNVSTECCGDMRRSPSAARTASSPTCQQDDDWSDRSGCAVAHEVRGSVVRPVDTVVACSRVSAAPERSFSSCPEMLRPLLQQWQSRRYGVIEVRPTVDDPQVLSFVPCGIGNVEDGACLGRVMLRRAPSGKVCIDMLPSRKSSSFSRMLVSRCRRALVVWGLDGTETVEDVWDRRLIVAAERALGIVQSLNLAVPCSVEGFAAGLAGAAGPAPSPLTVGLCMATKNRLWQLQLALPLNILRAWPHRRWVRFHVVVFGDDDALQFVLNKCRAAIDVGMLVVYVSEGLPYWHASIAKNTAHKVAREDILVNLDGDNIIGPDFLTDMVQRFVSGDTVLHYSNGSGTCGRVACKREAFHLLRGYDEDCYPMGSQDVDFRDRLSLLQGARLAIVKSNRGRICGAAIPNIVDDKVENCDPAFKLRWAQMDARNRETLTARKMAGGLQRNTTKASIGVGVQRVVPRIDTLVIEDECIDQMSL